jgi:flagellar basal-body rod modification protein FlgD
MTSGVSASSSNSGTTQQSGESAEKGSSQVTKNMFLQLLVAQIKNQDPLNPSDGVQFLTQLAQFEQLEQSLSLGQDVAAIRGALEEAAPAEEPAAA